MSRFTRQRGFLKSILKEAKQKEREQQLTHANKDQINAVSELVMNFLKFNIPTQNHVIKQLAPYKKTLREVAKRSHSVKRRKNILKAQKGGGFWKGLNHCFTKACRNHK